MSKRRVRADALLAERGFAVSVAEAGALILAGKVLVSEQPGKERKILKAGEPILEQARFRLKGDRRAYVSRAGHKLEAALDAFGVTVEGRVALDLGLSTGGFTDCLLQRGATRVHGVDVAYGIVDWRLRTDPRLVLHERVNARELALVRLGETVDLVVIDLSFIGLDAIWRVLPPLLAPGGEVVALVKPQFELPRDQVGEGGIVSSPKAREAALDKARLDARNAGLEPLDAMDCPVAGRSGNRELLLRLRVAD